MIKIELKGVEAVERAIASVGKQARYAASRALNDVAFKVMRAGREHITSGLDRPTPWTVKSWYVRKKATKDDLVASVGWSDYLANKQMNAAEYYLSQQWTGGGRQHKAFELRLQRARLMPSGMYAVPGKAAYDMGFIDARGNFKASVLVQILSSLSAFTERGYTANASVKQSAKRAKALRGSKAAGKQVYWAGKPGPNTPNGIWAIDEKHKRGRGRLRPVMVFVRSVSYRPRLDLDKIVSTIQTRDFVDVFWRELEQAMRTAR